jgi:hypothetical protein
MTAINSIVIPPSVKSFGPRCFAGCSNLTTVEFGKESVLKTIGERVLEESLVQTLVLPASVESIDGSALVTLTFLSLQPGNPTLVID